MNKEQSLIRKRRSSELKIEKEKEEFICISIPISLFNRIQTLKIHEKEPHYQVVERYLY